MLERDDLLSWFQRLAVSEQTCSLIDRIRSTGPSRRVGGGRSNVSGRYPSRKMGVTIQFESHRVELAGIYEMEHDSDVLEYFDQPAPIKLDYKSAAEKRMGVLHTPDFFVIRKEKAGWEEWKTEEDLKRLTERNANRYRHGEDGKWYCPPGEAYAERLGLYYRVRSSAEIDWVFQRNIQFLEDYFRADSPAIAAACREIAVAHVSATPGLSLEDLLQVTKETVPADEVFIMIATDILHVDICAAPLAEPSRVSVFPRAESALKRERVGARAPCSSFPGTLHCGSMITWDGRSWKLVNTGETAVSLLSEEQGLMELPIAAFESMVSQNRVQVSAPDVGQGVESAVHERLAKASEGDLRIANHRAQFISRYLDNGMLPAGTEVRVRTFYHWLAQYRQAEAICGSGFLGLLPRQAQRGNCTPKLPETSRRLMQEFIRQDYETLKQKTRYASWIKLRLACEEQRIPAPSYKTFCIAVRQRPLSDQILKRQGRRASYQVQTFHWELDQKTPRHGDRPFEVAHIDHTILDVQLVCSHTGQVLGRPWLTLLSDAFSRRTLAFYLTFDEPSYRSCMMVLRECVRRFSRFPQVLVVDGGREFESTYFETLLARYECTKKTRPPAEARFGSICERLFGAANTQFIHNLQGNTQITRNVRQVTKAVNPKGHAIWSLVELHPRLSQYLYDVRDRLNHPALGQSPLEAFQTGMVRGGRRLHRMVLYNQEFLMLTLPTTAKGTAKVTPSRGAKINHVHYWCDAFRDPEIQGKAVPVRYDPFDAGVAYAFVRKQWLPCHSEYFAVLKGRSEREIILATKELHQRHHNHSAGFTVTARILAECLQSVEAEEQVLTQRLRDSASRTIRLALSNDPTNENPMKAQLSAGDQTGDAKGGSDFSADDVTVNEVYGEF